MEQSDENALCGHVWEYGDGIRTCAGCGAAERAQKASVPRCPTCGPTSLEQHPRHSDVERCTNCKEWLRVDGKPFPPGPVQP